jgi:hypothetical protein
MRTQAQTEYDRRYREKRKNQPVPPDIAKERRQAFAAALEEITDPDIRNQYGDMLTALMAVFMQLGNLKQYAAENQALEILAALTWKGIAVPRKHQPAARAVAGD